jgi:hypothetical protein
MATEKRFYLVHSKKAQDCLNQWLISSYCSEEEAAQFAQQRSDVWVSACQDWTAAEIEAGCRCLTLPVADLLTEAEDGLTVSAVYLN